MDPLTHMLVGAAVADVVAPPKKTARGMLWFSMAMAAAPDLDLVPALVAAFPANPFSDKLFDADVAGLYHRSWTHAFPVMVLAGIVAGFAARRRLGNNGGPIRWITAAVFALLSHALLDMANGPVQFWLPFSHAWIGWANEVEGNLFIILPLMLCFLTNHPPAFENRRRLGTLALANALGARLSGGLGAMIRPRLLAALVLGCIGLGLAALHFASK